MNSKKKLFGYVLFILGFVFTFTLGRLLGERFSIYFITALPPILQRPVLPFLFVAILDGLYINPYENLYLWAKLIDKLDSDYEQRRKIAPLSAGLLVGFFSAWGLAAKHLV